MPSLPAALAEELTRARRIVARADLPEAWVEGAGGLAAGWADAEARENGWPPADVRVPSPAALPDVLEAVARGRLAGAPETAEVGGRMAADLAGLRREHGA
ncbi:hypothetical protein [Kytococcus sp. Marseille-QA3725]